MGSPAVELVERFDGRTPSVYAGKMVKIRSGEFAGQVYRLEDWQPLVFGWSWMSTHARGNPACLEYAVRSAAEKLPTDNHVYYGKVGPFGKIIHASQIHDFSGLVTVIHE